MKLTKILEALFKETGEGTAQPFEWNRKGSLKSFYESLKKIAKSGYQPDVMKVFLYGAKSEKQEYQVIFSCYLKKKNPMILRLVTKDTPKPENKPKDPIKYEMVVYIGFGAMKAGQEYSDEVTNLHEQYRMLATVIKCIEDFVNNADPEVKITELIINPKSDAPGDEVALDSRRGRIYLNYVKKNLSRLNGAWTAYTGEDNIVIRSGEVKGDTVIAKKD